MLYLLFLTSHDFHGFIQARRSIRRFGEEMPPLSSIMRAIEDGMYAPSPVNSQPWYFVVVMGERERKEIEERIEWLIPPQGKRAYIVVLWDSLKAPGWAGIACMGACCENILLGLHAEGLGGCWIGSIKEKDSLRTILKIPQHLSIFSIIACGYPQEKPLIETGEGRPYLDKKKVLHVPKVPVKERVRVIE